MRNNRDVLAVVLVMVLVFTASACTYLIEVDGDTHSVRVLLPTHAVTDMPTPTNTATPSVTPSSTATSTATATPSATVTPSATPSSTATSTPDATALPVTWIATLYHTPAQVPNTSTPTATPEPTEIIVSPTPDNLPTGTPIPTGEPVDDSLCYGGVMTTVPLNIRADHSISATKVGSLEVASRAQVVSLWIVDDFYEEWAKLADGTGWIAVWYGGNHYTYLDDDEPCEELPQDGPGAQAQPYLETSVGIHTLFDTREYSTTVLADVTGVIKTTTGNTYLGEIFKAYNPDGIWIYRGLNHDQPQIYEWLDPQLYVNTYLVDEWSAFSADYFEFVNETEAPDWEIFADFTIGVLEAANAHDTCLLWGSFAAGNPDYPAWEELARIIEWADEHPCGTNADGTARYHGIAVHGPLLVPSDIARHTGTWMDESHIARRLAYVNSQVTTYTGAGLADHASGNVYVTEIGLDDGYSGVWSDSGLWTCEEIARSLWYTRDVYEDLFPYVRGLLLWTFGDGESIWTDRQDCADTILAWASE